MNSKEKFKEKFGSCTRKTKVPDTHPSCLHLTSNQQQHENQTAYVVTKVIVVNS